MSRRTWIFVVLWLAAIAGAVAVDRPVAELSRDRHWQKPSRTRGDGWTWSANTFRLAETLKLPGTYGTTIAAAGALLLLHVRRPQAGWGAAAVVVALAGAISGLNTVLKWVVGRRRPVTGINPFDLDAFAGGIKGLFGAEADLSFPSGHACLAFATAAALGMALPRLRWLFYAVATLTAVERVAENAHYTSDAAVAAALGILSAFAAKALVDRIVARRDVIRPVDASWGEQEGTKARSGMK